MPIAFASDAVKFFCRSADLSIERRMGMLRWHVDLISFEQKTRRIPPLPPSLLLSLPLSSESWPPFQTILALELLDS